MRPGRDELSKLSRPRGRPPGSTSKVIRQSSPARAVKATAADALPSESVPSNRSAGKMSVKLGVAQRGRKAILAGAWIANRVSRAQFEQREGCDERPCTEQDEEEHGHRL